MSDLQDLYQELILDHNRSPRNCRRLEGAVCSADGYNPLCGDKIEVFVKLVGDVVEDVAFEGSGCAISTASASLMTESVKGKTVEEAKALFASFHDMLTRDGAGADTGSGPALGKLKVFSGVGRFPARVKCATLAWHTVKAALSNSGDTVTTE